MYPFNFIPNFISKKAICLLAMFACIWCPAMLIAQSNLADTIVSLPEVRVNESRVSRYAGGMNVLRIDSSILSMNLYSNLGEILNENTGLFVKSYGAGSLATLSSRGTSAVHTSILWEGIPVNLPNLGMSDLAQLPAIFFDNVEFIPGGSGALNGNGAIGGSLHLSDPLIFEKRNSAQVQMAGGSFGFGQGGIRINLGNDKIFYKAAAYYRQALNDFEYVNTAKFGSPVEKLLDASNSHYGTIHNIAFKLKYGFVLKSSVWFTHGYRNLPPAMTSRSAKETQEDNALKTSAEIQKQFKLSKLSLKSAFIKDRMIYTYPPVNLYSNIQSKQIFSDLNYHHRIVPNLEADAGFSVQSIFSDILAYNGKESQHRKSMYVSVVKHVGDQKLSIILNARKEFVNGFDVPFVPSLGTEVLLTKGMKWKVHVSRNFRVPTLNDLYWFPGGNPNLKPESSWNAETGINYVRRIESNVWKKTEFNATVYTALVNNWIQWVPGSNAYWIPENLLKVWSRGLESDWKNQFDVSKFKIKTAVSYSYTRSGFANNSNENSAGKGQQLMYVPIHTAYVNTSVSGKIFSFSYNHHYIGIRYLNNENSRFLPAFGLGNAVLGVNLPSGSYEAELSFHIKNIWNNSYQAMEWRPMPGRNYLINLNLKIK